MGAVAGGAGEVGFGGVGGERVRVVAEEVAEVEGVGGWFGDGYRSAGWLVIWGEVGGGGWGTYSRCGLEVVVVVSFVDCALELLGVSVIV